MELALKVSLLTCPPLSWEVHRLPTSTAPSGELVPFPMTK